MIYYADLNCLPAKWICIYNGHFSPDVHGKDILNCKIISNAARKGLVNSAIMER